MLEQGGLYSGKYIVVDVARLLLLKQVPLQQPQGKRKSASASCIVFASFFI